MTAILFVIGCAGFAIVIAWAYGIAALEAGSSGVGLLAMVESTPPDAKETVRRAGRRTPRASPAPGHRPADRTAPVPLRAVGPGGVAAFSVGAVQKVPRQAADPLGVVRPGEATLLDRHPRASAQLGA